MPVSRQCFYCKKKFLTSTYGLIHHIENNCSAYQDYLKNQNSEKINISQNIKEKTSETCLKKIPLNL